MWQYRWQSLFKDCKAFKIDSLLIIKNIFLCIIAFMKSLLNKLKTIKIEEYYIYILFFYSLLFIFIRVSIGSSLERDEAEQVLLTESFALGYGTQPPMYTWLQSIFFLIFGKTIFALALLKNILLFTAYFFIYKSSYIITKSKALASVAAASMILIPAYSWECQRDLTHTVLAFTIATITIYWVLYLRASSKTSLKDYILLGIIVAVGTLSKYNYILIPITLIVVSIFDTKLKQLIINKKILVSILLFIILVSPHFYWLSSNLEMATDGTLHKLHTSANFSFLDLFIKFILTNIELFTLYFIIFFLFFYRYLDQKANSFLKKYIFTITLLLLIVLITVGAGSVKSRWLVILFFPVVILLASKINPNAIIRARYFIYTSLFFMLIIIVVYLLRFYVPNLFKHPSRFNYPYKNIYSQLQIPNFKSIYYLSKLSAGNLKYFYPNANLQKLNNTIKSNSIIIIDKDNFSKIQKLEKSYNIKFTKIESNYLNSKDTKFIIYYFKSQNNIYKKR